MARGRWPLVALLGLVACGAGRAAEPRPGAEPGTPADSGSTRRSTAPSTPSSTEGPSSAASAAPRLERSYTGQDRPTLLVRNAYPRPQHVFVDWQRVGTVAPGATGSFELTVGAHTITSADSADPDDNPSSVTEDFEAGYGYRYQILAR